MAFSTKIRRRTIKKSILEHSVLDREIGKGKKVVAGVPSDAPSYPNGKTMATVAMINEFGINEPNARIPERPFMRNTMDENRKKYLKMAKAGLRDVLTGKASVDEILGEIGVEAQGDIQQTITDFDDPGNAKYTIQRKKEDDPLIETGALRQNITYEVRDMNDEN